MLVRIKFIVFKCEVYDYRLMQIENRPKSTYMVIEDSFVGVDTSNDDFQVRKICMALVPK